jgi:hypothetical protein
MRGLVYASRVLALGSKLRQMRLDVGTRRVGRVLADGQPWLLRRLRTRRRSKEEGHADDGGAGETQDDSLHFDKTPFIQAQAT